jgi:hypothetical protein
MIQNGFVICYVTRIICQRYYFVSFFACFKYFIVYLFFAVHEHTEHALLALAIITPTLLQQLNNNEQQQQEKYDNNEMKNIQRTYICLKAYAVRVVYIYKT